MQHLNYNMDGDTTMTLTQIIKLNDKNTLKRYLKLL